MIVFDLDGTLTDHSHRLPMLFPPPGWSMAIPHHWRPDYAAYHAACLEDPPRRPVLGLLSRLMSAGLKVEIWTCRPETYRPLTQQWLRRWAPYVQDCPLRMRTEGDLRPSEVVKGEWLERAMSEGTCIEMVFEDRDKLVQFWRARGILCLQVAEGAF